MTIMELRKATSGELDAIMRILAEAREAQRAQGFVQWEDGYPPVSTVMADMERGEAYVLADRGKIAGYAAIAAGDVEYDRLRHIWRTDCEEYAAIHRVALADSHRGRGLSCVFLLLIEREVRRRGIMSVRIDTGVENKAMQRILEKCGYTGLGVRDFVWGRRLAYEKRLQP